MRDLPLHQYPLTHLALARIAVARTAQMGSLPEWLFRGAQIPAVGSGAPEPRLEWRTCFCPGCDSEGGASPSFRVPGHDHSEQVCACALFLLIVLDVGNSTRTPAGRNPESSLEEQITPSPPNATCDGGPGTS